MMIITQDTLRKEKTLNTILIIGLITMSLLFIILY